jgi:O-antigen/teichoic acid export membrane protein
VVFGLVSANAVVAPLIARLHATGRHDELQHMTKLAAKGICLMTLPIALVLLIFGRQILELFGEGFSAGYPVLAILVCGQLVNALAGPVGYLMSMTGHQNKAAAIVGFSACLNLALNGLLIPLWGMLGAAIATALSTATWNILMLRFVQKELEIRCSALQFFGRAT